jgi:glutaconate CoA-transferase, subunit B
VDVGFLGAAQMDRYGNINTTVIGPYESPKVRLPGAGGAPEIAASAKEVAVILRQKPRAFVEELAFVTSIGYRYGGDSRTELGYSGAGPTVVITDLGILRPDVETKELTMTALHPARRHGRGGEGGDGLEAHGGGRAGDDRSTDGEGAGHPA